MVRRLQARERDAGAGGIDRGAIPLPLVGDAGTGVQCTFHRLNGKEPEYLRRNPRGIWYEHLTEVTLNGDYEVTFNLSQPQPSLLAMLASGYTAVYPCHVSGRDMRVKPIGTGPFKLVEFKSNDSIRLVKNPDYWKKGQPYLDAIEWRIVPSRSTRLLAFAAGEFDLTQTADVTPPLLNDVKKNAPKAICAMLPTNVTTHMLVNREKPPFDNPELRRAMILSLDRQAFIDILALGKARLAVNMMPPPEGNWGMPIEELKKLPSYGDPVAQREEARKIMEKLGYGPSNRLKVKVATRDFNNFRDPAVILVDQLNKIHFDAELDVVESSVWYNRLFKKDYSVALNLAGAGIDDPDGVLKMGFACKSEANFSQYCNPEVDKLLDQQSQEPDLAKRKATVWKIERILVEDVARPIIFHGIGRRAGIPISRATSNMRTRSTTTGGSSTSGSTNRSGVPPAAAASALGRDRFRVMATTARTNRSGGKGRHESLVFRNRPLSGASGDAGDLADARRGL